MKSFVALSALAATAAAAPQRAGPVALVNPHQVALDGFSEDVNQDGFVDPIAPAALAHPIGAYGLGLPAVGHVGAWWGKRSAEPQYWGPLNLGIPHGALGAVLHPNGAVAPPYTPDQQLALAEKAKILADRGQLIKREAEADPQLLLGGGLLGGHLGGVGLGYAGVGLAAPAVAAVAPAVAVAPVAVHTTVPVTQTFQTHHVVGSHTETIPLGVKTHVVSAPLIKREAEGEAEAAPKAIELGGVAPVGPALPPFAGPTYTLPALPQVHTAHVHAASTGKAVIAPAVGAIAAPALGFPAFGGVYAAAPALPALAPAPAVVEAAPAVVEAAPAVVAAPAPIVAAPAVYHAPAVVHTAVPITQTYQSHHVVGSHVETVPLGVRTHVVAGPVVHGLGGPILAAAAPAAVVAAEPAAAVVEE